jgi:uncharacterized protein YbjT (DUF2867 family)
MRIAITTPTGHIGTKVTDILLDWGAKVVLLVRDVVKVQHFARRGAEVKRGSLDDAKFVTDATRGVDALFWVTPPNMTSPDYRGFQKSVGSAAAAAIRDNQISRVVNLSSFGVQVPFGCGPVSGLHDVEELLNAVAGNITHLRAGFFYENFLYQLENIRRDSAVYMPLSGLTRVPMLATRDIAEASARLLLNGQWTGQNIRGLHGPADLSLNEAVGQISEGLGHQVRFVKVPAEAARKAMLSMGMSPNVADGMIELYRALNSGLLRRDEPRTAETTTPTTLIDFARDVIMPQLLQPVHA